MSTSPAPFCRHLLGCLPVLLTVILLISPVAWGEESFATYPVLSRDYSSIKIYDRQGRFVGRILPEQRYWVTLDRIPLLLRQAVVAVEDARFYEHGGIDMRGIARALVKDVVKGELVEGGSTITQQLIKNRYLSSEKTFDRKFKEGMMAVDFERKYTKDQILEMYLNEIYFGNGAWGIAQAALFYFDKRPEELDDAECVLLAGVPKNPSRYNPAGDAVKVQQRRDVVLKRMEEVKFITAVQKTQLRSQRVNVTPRGQAPYYLNHLRGKLVESFGPQIVEEGGMEVTAALDLNLQRLAEQTLHDGVARLSPQLQGALVSLDPTTGDLLAAVGGVDYSTSSYNRALYARRQPGSAVKPMVYAAALEQGYTVASLWNDTPVAYPNGKRSTWKPLNYGRESYGTLSLRRALTLSNNVITVKLLDTIGVPNLAAFAERIGLPLRAPHELSLALGTAEVTPLELVQAYAPLANGGMRPELRTILRIVDHHRNAVTEYPPQLTMVLEPGSAYVVTSMLKDVLDTGTARGLASFARSRPAAGKTGTTDDSRDAWFIGYTPQLVTGVWVGYDQPKPGGKGFTGGGVCAPIWERFMRPALAAWDPVDFEQPETVVTFTIDPATGYLATPDCPEVRQEVFLVGSEPVVFCPDHGGDQLPALPPPPFTLFEIGPHLPPGGLPLPPSPEADGAPLPLLQDEAAPAVPQPEESVTPELISPRDDAAFAP